jgi:hypothetical protein
MSPISPSASLIEQDPEVVPDVDIAAVLTQGATERRPTALLHAHAIREEERRAARSERDPLRDKVREVGRGLSLADTQTGR